MLTGVSECDEFFFFPTRVVFSAPFISHGLELAGPGEATAGNADKG